MTQSERHLQLRELQRDLQRYLLSEDSAITGAIVDAPPLSAADRLSIYRNAYQGRLVEALGDSYPILHGLLGDDEFATLADAFVTTHPSSFRSVRWYGGDLADFLASAPPYDEQPILSEVALLEWTLAEVFDAADAEPTTRAALAAVDPSMWGNLKFEFHPSLRRLAFRWNTVAVWKAMSADQIPPAPELSGARVGWLLWRQHLQNYFRSMGPAESAALDAALRGLSFAEICEELTACMPEDQIPPAAAGLLGTWADSGIIISAS